MITGIIDGAADTSGLCMSSVQILSLISERGYDLQELTVNVTNYLQNSSTS